MKLLISTYACAPNCGSEHAVGWNWTTEAHRLGHQVWAAAIDAACRPRVSLRAMKFSPFASTA